MLWSCHVHVCVQACWCGKETRSVLCGSQESFESRYSCGNVCSRDLDCGRHRCDRQCHAGPCDSCSLQPDHVTRCPCGKTALASIPSAKPRLACTDEVPTCQLTCLKPLLCGSDGKLVFFTSLPRLFVSLSVSVCASVRAPQTIAVEFIVPLLFVPPPT